MHLRQFGTVTIVLLLLLLAFSSIFLLPEFFLLFYDFLCILFVSRCEGSLGPGFRQVHLTVRLARTKCILCLRLRCVSWGSRSRASRHLTVNFSRSRDQVVDTISFALSACFSDLWCWKCN